MEDIRLFSIPPTHRQLDDGLNNSSDTESPEELSELARVEEEASPGPAPGIFEQYITTNHQPDNARFLEDWLTSAGLTPVPGVLGAEPIRHKYVKSPINIGNAG